MKSPGCEQDDGSSVKAAGKSNRAQSISDTVDLGGQFPCMGEGSAVALDSDATANMVCSQRLGFRKSPWEKTGSARVPT